MDEDRRREVGLFRYALIRDAADPVLSKAERGRLVRALVDREHVGPDGRLVRVGRTTLDRLDSLLSSWWVRGARAARRGLRTSVRRGAEHASVRRARQRRLISSDSPVVSRGSLRACTDDGPVLALYKGPNSVPRER